MPALLLLFVFANVAAKTTVDGIVPAPVILQPTKATKPEKLLVLIPGGKVPPEDYSAVGKAIQKTSNMRLWVAIPGCLANLCDPVDQGPLGLKKVVDAVIVQVGKSATNLLKSDVFIAGHSLGGVGARYVVDQEPGYAGLALFGTQYVGDHEDFRGGLGYPEDITKFPMPLLALTGE